MKKQVQVTRNSQFGKHKASRLAFLRPVRMMYYFCIIAGLYLLSFVVFGACSSGPLRVDPLQKPVLTRKVDQHFELARRYAPWIFHASHKTKGRQDIPTRVDFDGDMRGDNNWEHFPLYELIPTVYYACLESETHYFLTYHLFHPRDWSFFDFGIHTTHENDGENLQVVVEKSSGEVVLLVTQAHFKAFAYALQSSNIGGGAQGLRGDFLLMNEEGELDSQGKHVCVFVEEGGHGIYSASDECAKLDLVPGSKLVFEDYGFVLHPASEGEEVGEPVLGTSGKAFGYKLESSLESFWKPFLQGVLVGEGKLLDGAVRYQDERNLLMLPRYYEANRFSGPLGPDRGISPFAFDFSFCEGQVGWLFFDPAKRYSETLEIAGPWSFVYQDYSFHVLP